jgi:hypothetical protein
MGAYVFTDLMYKERTPPVRVKATISMLRSEDDGRRTGMALREYALQHADRIR